MVQRNCHRAGLVSELLPSLEELVRRIAELVLRHRLLVVIVWVVLLVAGAISAGQTSKRLKIDFSVPGQPGTTAANRIVQEFGNGGFTDPTLLTLTAPTGQHITGHEADVAATFQAALVGRPALRLLDESNADAAITYEGVFRTVFRTRDDRTAYGLVVYPFVHQGKDAFLLPSIEFRPETPLI